MKDVQKRHQMEGIGVGIYSGHCNVSWEKEY